MFNFLKPKTIIDKIYNQAYAYIDTANAKGNNQNLKKALIENIEQLAEMCKGAKTTADQSLGLNCLTTINHILLHYLESKRLIHSPGLGMKILTNIF